MASYATQHYPERPGQWRERQGSYERRRPSARSPSHSPNPRQYTPQPHTHAPPTRGPPPPSAEDETRSLAREKSPPPGHCRDDDARSRGSIDQVPLIEDVNGLASDAARKPDSNNSSASSSGRETPLTSNSQNEEKRFVIIPRDERDAENQDRPQSSRPDQKKAKGKLHLDLDSLPAARSRETSPLVTPARDVPARAGYPATAAAQHPASSQGASKNHGGHQSSGSGSGSRDRSSSKSVRNSQYSFNAADLKKIDQSLNRETNGTGPSPSSKPIRPPLTPDPANSRKPWYNEDQQNLSSSTPGRSYFPMDGRRSPMTAKPSSQRSSFHSPHATPPASPGREYNAHDWNPSSSSGRRSRPSSRPSTPSMLSPPHPTSFPQSTAERLQPPPLQPPRATTNPIDGSSFLQPPSAGRKPQPPMVEIKKDPATNPFTLKTRQTAPMADATPSASYYAATAPIDIPQSAPPTKHSFNPAEALRPTSRDCAANSDPRSMPSTKPLNQTNVPMPDPAEFDSSRMRRSAELPARPRTESGKPAARSRSVQPPALPALPVCPRSKYVAGLSDWSTLPGHPNFDICPSCRKGLEDAGSAAKFIPSPKRPSSYSTRCDLSTPWVRMAWLLLLQSRPTHATVVDQITSTLSCEPPCPGKQLAPRNWYGLYSTESSKFLPTFDVCPTCVRLVEALFPNLKGRLQRSSGDPTRLRTCDLREDSQRFVKYVDLLDSISKQGYEVRREPSMAHFVQLAQRLTAVRECREDDQLKDLPWYFMPGLPDFTVCEECYWDQVWPLIQQNYDLANRFNRRPDFPPLGRIPLSCQLYSARMRDVWKRACQTTDYEALRSAATARAAKERDLQARHAQLAHWPEDQRKDEGARLVSEWRRWA